MQTNHESVDVQEPVAVAVPDTPASPWWDATTWSDALCTVLFVIPLSILGDASRQFLTVGVAGNTSSVFLVNIVGCFLLGFAHVAHSWRASYPRSHAAFCIGYCGSLTTFSTWMMNVVATHRGSPLAALSELFLGLSAPMLAYVAACDVAGSPVSLSPRALRVLAVAAALLVLVLLVLFVVLTVVMYSDYQNHPHAEEMRWATLYTSLLAPAGALPRYAFGYHLNKKLLVPSWGHGLPYGTYCANVSAFVLVGVLYASSCTHSFACSAVSAGIGGALSTVSSWVAETYELRKSRGMWVAYGYYVGSVVSGIGICGVLVWSTW